MAAHYHSMTCGCQSLIFEPDEPLDDERSAQGWVRLRDGQPMRRYSDDIYGARVQRAILRYLLLGTPRKVLAAELGVTETTFQECLCGRSWRFYGRPVLRALRRLGIGTHRGQFTEQAQRLNEVVSAQRQLLTQAADMLGEMLAGTPHSPAAIALLLADLRLLSAVHEEHEP